MAKVLTHQPRLWGVEAEDPRQFGDGAPLHSAIPFDSVRALNNMQTYREPSFQFAHDGSMTPVDGDSAATSAIRYRVKAGGFGDGSCLLGQIPIYVAVEAQRLRWSFGFYRVPGSSETGVNLNVDTITMYLSSEPVRQLSAPPGVAAADDEVSRAFIPSYLTAPYTSNFVSAFATANGSGGIPQYTKVRSSSWNDFAPRGTANVNDRNDDPWAYLIVTAQFNAGTTNESIRGAELSVWFEYDDETAFLMDDASRGPARNGRPAIAQVMRRVATAANKFSIRARPILSWWGGNAISPFETAAESSVRRMRLTSSLGAPRLGGQALVVPIAVAASVPRTGLLVTCQDDDQTLETTVPQSPGILEDLNDAQSELYPRHATAVPLFGEHVADYSGGVATAREVRIQAGSAGPVYGPQLRSGLIFERRPRGRVGPQVGPEVLPLDPYSMGSEIIGEGSEWRDLRAVRNFINRLAREKMIHFGWGLIKNSATGTYGFNVTTSAGTNYRYLLNPAYGEGGIAPTVDGPGIDIPVRYTSLGLGTTVRAYVRIYARMTGATDSATLGYYKRNDAGGMDGLSVIANTPTISGTTWQWYPNTDAIDEGNDPYVTLNANPAYDTDNLVLCARRNGTTDNLLIGAWTICVRASEAP